MNLYAEASLRLTAIFLPQAPKKVRVRGMPHILLETQIWVPYRVWIEPLIGWLSLFGEKAVWGSLPGQEQHLSADLPSGRQAPGAFIQS